MKQIPVLVRDDLNEDQVMAARVADNRVAIGDVDTQMLQKEMEQFFSTFGELTVEPRRTERGNTIWIQ